MSLSLETFHSPRDLMRSVDYLAALLDTEEGGVSPELQAEFDTALQKAITTGEDSAERVAKVFIALSVSAESTQAEIDAWTKAELVPLIDRKARFERELERLRNVVMTLMLTRGLDVIKGSKHRFQLDGLPAKVAEQGYAPADVPDDFKKGSVTLDAETWEQIIDPSTTPERRAELAKGVKIDYAVDKKALLSALKEACPQCKGHKVVPSPAAAESMVCPRCVGKGTRIIKGALLESGRKKLVLKA